MKAATRSDLFLGVDLGGTKILVALVDAEGRVLASHRRQTGADRGFERIVAGIGECVQRCLAEAGSGLPSAAGIGVAGQVDPASGIVRFAPNLGWHDAPLRQALELLLGLPVVVTNDVRAATWGEWKYGAGRGVSDLVVLFIGTGVGGGAVIGGHLLQGCSGSGGELGHTILLAEGRACRCRNRGCLEAYVGGWAIAERAREAIRVDPASGHSLLEASGGIGAVTAEVVAHVAKEGDRLALRIVEETVHYLAAGAVGIVNAFNPCTLVLGGGVIDGMPEAVTRVGAIVRKRALRAAAEPLRVVSAELGSQAGALGAALFARHTIKQSGRTTTGI